MSIYDQYALVYDESGQIGFSLQMIPYLDALLRRHPVPGRTMLDLACGTGTVALAFAQQNWEVYGVDASANMLSQAQHKADQTQKNIILSQQDMRRFVLPHPVALVTCLYDSLNYMLTLTDLQQVFERVAAALVSDGLFVADMNTCHALEHVWGNSTFFVENKHLAIVMDSAYEATSRLSNVHIVGFVEQSDGLYLRFDEYHTETAYEHHEIEAAFESAGLKLEAAYECFAFQPPDAETARIMWVARKVASHQDVSA